MNLLKLMLMLGRILLANDLNPPGPGCMKPPEKKGQGTVRDGGCIG